MPIPILQTWFGKKPSAASPPPPKDRSGIRIGIPKVLNVWSTHQFWVGFLRDLGISSENIVFSSDSSEEQNSNHSEPDDLFAPLVSSRPCFGNLELHARHGRP